MNFEDIKDENLFAVDRRGYRIHCDEEQMNRIYAHHPELWNFWATKEDFSKAITDSYFIYQSRKGVEFNIYYLRKSKINTELKIVVKFQGDVGIIYAAQPVSKRQPGEVLIWPKTSL